MGRLPSDGIPDARAAGGASCARRVPLQRRRARAPNRLRTESGVGANEQTFADRVQALPLKPERLAERIGEALTEPDPLRAMLVMSELQADTVALAPSGPNIDRAHRWLREVIAVLRKAIHSGESSPTTSRSVAECAGCA